MRLASTVALAALVCVTASSPTAQVPAVAAQLDRYFSGEFDAVIADLTTRRHFDEVLAQLKQSGRAWVDAGAPADRARRELTAATFALEAARLAADTTDWKWVQRLNLNVAPELLLPSIGPPSYRAPDSLYWQPPPLLIEWGCALMRASHNARAVERVWQLASVAVADRAGDFEFLVGNPWGDRGNPQDELQHLAHVIKRFPDEPRFALAQAIAIEWRTWPVGYRRPRSRMGSPAEAIRALQGMTKDAAIGAEASLRLGVLQLRASKLDDALTFFDRVDAATRDTYLVYLARYFRGQALERKNQAGDAERAYRSALATIPRAESATMALSALLVKGDHQNEASSLVEASLTGPPVFDPWRGYEAADDRFWPQLIARLRAEIQMREGLLGSSR